MTVFKQKHGVTYRYAFRFQGHPYRGTTHQRIKSDAELVEQQIKTRVRQRAAGLEPASPAETPTFSAWADVALAYQTKFITRPELLERTLRMVLSFWGSQPTRAVGPAAVARAEKVPRPYHGLRLGDPIADPSWLERFEQWMDARGVSVSTRNSYLSACSDLYACALQPQFRAATGITTNPFAGIRRGTPRSRVVALTPAQILQLVTEAGRHIAHALCIAALAPKLRVASILALEWATHLDPDLTTITITDHKTRSRTGLAQVVPVSSLLRAILSDIRASQAPPSRYVITWRDKPVASIKTGLRRAVEAIGLQWGLRDGVTFHVMRHSVATVLANPALVGALTERLRADVMGHRELRTTQQYTHLNPSAQAGPHEALAAALPGLRSAAQKPTPITRVKSMITPIQPPPKPQQKRILAFDAESLPDRGKSKIS